MLARISDIGASAWGEHRWTPGTPPGTLEHDPAQYKSELQISVYLVASITYEWVDPKTVIAKSHPARRGLMHLRGFLLSTANPRSVGSGVAVASKNTIDLVSWTFLRIAAPASARAVRMEGLGGVMVVMLDARRSVTSRRMETTPTGRNRGWLLMRRSPLGDGCCIRLVRVPHECAMWCSVAVWCRHEGIPFSVTVPPNTRPCCLSHPTGSRPL